MTSKLKRLLTAGAIAIAATLSSAAAFAGNQLAVAIGGYDTVSYFQDGGPQQGVARYHAFWNGAVWYFANAENRDAFVADPEAFAPAHAPSYDGYCAWAASQNYKRPGDPNVWQIEEGRLFLFVHEGARDMWRENIAQYIVQGDENWVRIAPY